MWIGFAGELSFAQTLSKDSVVIHFPRGYRYVIPSFQNNAEELKRFVSVLQNARANNCLEQIIVEAHVSPDGDFDLNQNLLQLRSDSIVAYIIRHAKIPVSKVNVLNKGFDYRRLTHLVEIDSNLPHRKEVLKIFQDILACPFEKERECDMLLRQQLWALDNGVTYHYLLSHQYPQMRCGVLSIFMRRESLLPATISGMPFEPLELPMNKDFVPFDSLACSLQTHLKQNNEWVIKTNLPYYAFVVPNIAIERSFAAHWSVDIPLWYSPYTIARNYRFRILALQPSLRYWLHQSLQGHFLAVHALWGQFNISVNHQTRYQDFRGMWGGGIDYGYALRLKNRWGMEFNLGAGYIRTRYETYFNRKNGALYGKHLANYWGVTRLGISLTYKL